MTNLATPLAPGPYVTIAAAAGTSGSPKRTGIFFATGQCAEGPTGVPIPLTSLQDFLNYCGPRAAYGYLCDVMDEYFHDGGQLAYVSRVVGPEAATATVTISDQNGSPADTISISANGPGASGNALSAVVAAGPLVLNRTILATVAASTTLTDPAGSFTTADVGRTVAGTGIPADTTISSITSATEAVMSASGTTAGTGVSVTISAPSYTISIYQSGALVAFSPSLQSPADAVAWATTTQPWAFPVVIANLGSSTASPKNNPATGTYYLSGGADDVADVTETQWTDALTAFNTGLAEGVPGQVAAPGHNTVAGWGALVAHASAYNRFALLDDVDSATASAVVADAVEAQASGSVSTTPYSAMFGPWITIPGIQQATTAGSPTAPTRTVPPSALVAALCARNDQQNDANVAAAGPNGQSTYAIDVTQTYVNADRATLNSAGVSVIRNIGSVVQLYGNVSMSTDPNWTQLSNCRMRMQMADDFNAIAANHMFAELDQQSHALSALAGDITGQCLTYQANGSIYNFFVNTGSSVNTLSTEAQGEMIAEVGVQFSPSASWVFVPVTKYPITASLPS